VLKVFGGRQGYRRFVLDGLGQGHKGEHDQLEDQRFLGSEEFGEKVQEELEGDREQARRKPLRSVVENVAKRLGVSPEVLRGPERSWRISRVRGLVAYVLTRRMGFAVKEVAAYLRKDQTSISSLLTRLSQRMATDEALKQECKRICDIV
jgi:chromosomal replication initiation ATPase DnaA